MSSRQRKFEVLVGALTDDLYRYAYWLCRDKHLAEDLVQETLLRAWRFMHKLRDSKAVKSWLITTLRREHARIYERKRLDYADVDEALVEDMHSPDPGMEMDRSQLHARIMALDVAYREPLAMQVILGCSVAEISGILDLSESAVMTRLFRARKKIVAEYEADLPAVQAGES